MKKYNIKISKAALKTLDQNILFLRKFDINYSIKVREKIIKSIDKLMLFPYSYSYSIYKKSNKYVYRKFIVNKFYYIIYTINKNEVIIIYIIDARGCNNTYFKSLK